MARRWRYGNAWEKFPIRPGEVWKAGTGKVAVGDLFQELPGIVSEADLLFIDPPWTTGNLRSFYTKAEKDERPTFEAFAQALFHQIDVIRPHTCFIEMGRERVDEIFERLPFPIKQRWPVTYYKKHPCWLLRGSTRAETLVDYTGMDEEDCIHRLAHVEVYQTIGDICMGRGLVGVAAFQRGRSFVGTELNERRLACLLEKLHHAGGEVRRCEETHAA